MPPSFIVGSMLLITWVMVGFIYAWGCYDEGQFDEVYEAFLQDCRDNDRMENIPSRRASYVWSTFYCIVAWPSILFKE